MKAVVRRQPDPEIGQTRGRASLAPKRRTWHCAERTLVARSPFRIVKASRGRRDTFGR